jgi:hypothetical protein
VHWAAAAQVAEPDLLAQFVMWSNMLSAFAQPA